jgi:hypothetical protein
LAHQRELQTRIRADEQHEQQRKQQQQQQQQQQRPQFVADTPIKRLFVEASRTPRYPNVVESAPPSIDQTTRVSTTQQPVVETPVVVDVVAATAVPVDDDDNDVVAPVDTPHKATNDTSTDSPQETIVDNDTIDQPQSTTKKPTGQTPIKRLFAQAQSSNRKRSKPAIELANQVFIFMYFSCCLIDFKIFFVVVVVVIYRKLLFLQLQNDYFLVVVVHHHYLEELDDVNVVLF